MLEKLRAQFRKGVKTVVEEIEKAAEPAAKPKPYEGTWRTINRTGEGSQFGREDFGTFGRFV